MPGCQPWNKQWYCFSMMQLRIRKQFVQEVLWCYAQDGVVFNNVIWEISWCPKMDYLFLVPTWKWLFSHIRIADLVNNHNPLNFLLLAPKLLILTEGMQLPNQSLFGATKARNLYDHKQSIGGNTDKKQCLKSVCEGLWASDTGDRKTFCFHQLNQFTAKSFGGLFYWPPPPGVMRFSKKNLKRRLIDR